MSINNNCFSQKINVFHGKASPEPGEIVGYGALINYYDIKVPLPDMLSLISEKHSKYDTEDWHVFTPRHKPQDTLYGHILFALKYEGIDLYILKKLFIEVGKSKIEEIILAEPHGKYSRKIWFLYEWLLEKKLNLDDIKIGNFVDLVDEKIQYTGSVNNSKRHRIRNNLPGNVNFCPMIRKTGKLEAYIAKNLSMQIDEELKGVHKDILMRTAAFLLLKDSKASYAIEGETPPQTRAQRWGKALGQAGKNLLSKDEFIRLQQIVLRDDRFTKLGWREEGGFIGEHDRSSSYPIPDHISAKWQDIDNLIDGVITMSNSLTDKNYDAVLLATTIAFGFVFIHPFADGNGRLHRYLIHHVLAEKGFSKKGIIFPVSAVILENIDGYRLVLEHYSEPKIEFIEWEETVDHNVNVLNETIDLYRYYDATVQAEFLYECVEKTILETIPKEVEYLTRYDEMKSFIINQFDMPDKTIALLIKFLDQGKGVLSHRVKTKEFELLTEEEVETLEKKYKDIFHLT